MVMLTRLEEILLMAIWRLIPLDSAYGVPIKREVLERTGKDITIGALYFALDQLHKKGYVTKSAGAPTPERGGKRKTFYELTQLGEEGLENARKIHLNLWNDVPDVAFTSGKEQDE